MHLAGVSENKLIFLDTIMVLFRRRLFPGAVEKILRKILWPCSFGSFLEDEKHNHVSGERRSKGRPRDGLGNDPPVHSKN